MKKICSLLIIMAAGFSSCKKSHSCDCTTVITFKGKSPQQSASSHPIGEKTSQDQAAAICKATEAQLNEHLEQQLEDPNVSSTSSAECAVK